MNSGESEDESDGSEGDEYYCDGCTAKPDADPDAPSIEGHRWHKTGEEYDLCRECFVGLSAREQRKYEEFDENNMPVKLMRGRRSGVGAADQAAAAAAAAAAASAAQAEAAMAAAAAAASSSGSDDGGTSSDAEDDDDDSDEEDDEYYCDGDGCAVMYGAGADAPSISGHRWHKRGEEYDLCQTCFTALPQAERVKYQEFDEQQMPVGLNRGRRGVVGVGGDVQGNLALAARAASEAAAREAAALAELDDLDLDMDFGGGSGGEQQQEEEEEEEEEEESSSESEVSSSGEEEEDDGASDALAARLAEEAAARRSAEAAAARSAAELQRLKQQQQQAAALAREEAARRSAEAAAARSAAELQRLKQQQQQQQQQAAEAEAEAAASEKEGTDSDSSSASEDEGGDTDDDGDEYFCDSCAEMDGVDGADSDPIRGHRFHKVGHEWDVCQSCFSRLAPSQRLLYEEFDADGIPVKAKRGRRGVVVQGDIAASAAAAQFEASQSHRSSEQPGLVVPESYSPLPGLIPQAAGGASDVTWQQQLAAAAAQHAAEVAELLSAHRAELSASQEACAEAVSRAFPSWNRSILTEIFLCHACSDQEIEDGNGRAGEAARGADGGAGRAAAGGGAAAAAAAGGGDLEAVRGRVAGRGAAEAGGGGAPA
eukprot:COSAG01_NODE_335_length_18690_cov_7.693185_2_plen_656_part_00